MLEGATNLQKGLEKVRRARTTYGRWLSVDHHGAEGGSSYSRVTLFSFLGRPMNRSKTSIREVSRLPLSVEWDPQS